LVFYYNCVEQFCYEPIYVDIGDENTTIYKRCKEIISTGKVYEFICRYLDRNAEGDLTVLVDDIKGPLGNLLMENCMKPAPLTVKGPNIFELENSRLKKRREEEEIDEKDIYTIPRYGVIDGPESNFLSGTGYYISPLPVQKQNSLPKITFSNSPTLPTPTLPTPTTTLPPPPMNYYNPLPPPPMNYYNPLPPPPQINYNPHPLPYNNLYNQNYLNPGFPNSIGVNYFPTPNPYLNPYQQFPSPGFGFFPPKS
jgi:hypothetical protein